MRVAALRRCCRLLAVVEPGPPVAETRAAAARHRQQCRFRWVAQVRSVGQLQAAPRVHRLPRSGDASALGLSSIQREGPIRRSRCTKLLSGGGLAYPASTRSVVWRHQGTPGAPRHCLAASGGPWLASVASTVADHHAGTALLAGQRRIWTACSPTSLFGDLPPHRKPSTQPAPPVRSLDRARLGRRVPLSPQRSRP
jgi:hypothetical protein